METVLIELAKATPSIGILLWVVWYFKGELKREREDNKELNIVIREMQKEMLEVLQNFTNATKELTNAIKYGKE